MKKKLVFCFVCFCCLLTSCGVIPKESLLTSYELIENEDYLINETSQIGFKAINYKDVSTYVLTYFNENLDISEEEGIVKSLKVGKTCISLTGSILNINHKVNKNILVDLVKRLNISLNDKSDIVKIYENLEIDTPYIISENDSYVFIDYITMIPTNNNYVVYYRVILQDISQLNTSLSKDEYNILSDNLEELLDILGINETIELPKKDIVFVENTNCD